MGNLSSIDYKMLLNEISSRDIDENTLNAIIKVLYHVHKEVVTSQKGLTIKLNLTTNEINTAFKYLTKRGFVELTVVNNVEIYSLTDKAKEDFNDVLKDLHLYKQFQHLIANIENETPIIGVPADESIPSFIGCFIADKAGKTLLTFELYDGALETFIKRPPNISIPLEGDDMPGEFDIELVPMFVSALEKFSREINMQELSELKITGINLKMQTFSYEKYTVTFFVNPSVNIKPIEKKVRDYFQILFSKYKEEFEVSLRTGFVDNISHLNELGQEMLKELNKYVYLVEFKNIVGNLDEYDQTHAKHVYGELNKLQDECLSKFSLMIEKIKKLKIYALKTMLNDDLEELKEIINKMQVINSKLNSL
jgi:DNA-binding PadR family transcriptional regulator